MSNPNQENEKNQINEREILIKKLKFEFMHAQNEEYRQTIEHALFLVGDFLKLNRICIISSALDTPIQWSTPELQSDLSCFDELKIESVKNWIEDDSMVDGLIYFNAQDRLLSDMVGDNQHTISVINLSISKDCIGFIFMEKSQLKHRFDPHDVELLTNLSHLISTILIHHHYQKENLIWMEKARSANLLKDQFLSNINHEIQTPLSGIHNAMYLLGSTDLNNEQKEFLQIAQASLERLSSVVEDVLNISKLESGQVEIHHVSFDLEEELIRILRIQKSSATEKGLKLSLSYDQNIAFELIGDLKKLRQILMNLISNAIKYTEKGAIVLSAAIVSNDPFSVLFSIVDTGIGIDVQESKKIYEQFYQSDASLSKKQQGIGLGLSIVSNLVRLLNGKLDMESELNQGTTFKVQLPFEKGPSFEFPLMKNLSALFTSEYTEDLDSFSVLSAMGVIPYTIHQALETKFDLIVLDGYVHDIDQIETLKKVYGNEHVLIIHFQSDEPQKIHNADCSFKKPIAKHTIYKSIQKAIADKKIEKGIISEYSATLDGYALIVDDNRLNRVALESILKKMGMKSKSVASGALAIQTVTNEFFDVILMDLQMPEMDGLEATRRIRHLGKKYMNIPIIAVTANTYIKDYDLMKSAQINDVIFKPIQFEQLQQMLRKYIKSENEIHIPDELFVFDSYDFKMRFEGSDDIADEVVKSFLDEYSDDMKKISAAIQSKNATKIIETTHYFKGSCSYLSGKRVVWLLGFMIEQAKFNELRHMDHCLDMLYIEIKSLVESIEAYKRKTTF